VKLLIAIPALNEEDSIATTIERTLTARAAIIASGIVSDVEVTVVSDGSTDQTVERARRFGNEIRLIVFEQNRGYGAAIMEAWRQSDAELLAFLDADGTCDPAFFVELCGAMARDHAHISLGSRMHAASRMPLLRRAGNLVFASMLTAFGSSRVRDAASGMRVVRRSCLPRLMPLPTGLHFTPAMSARAILAGDLRIVEVEMPYHERAGRSKLSPFRDGIRFTRVILSAAFLYRPSRPLGAVALLFAGSAVGWSLRLIWQLSRVRMFEDWMVYHFVVIQLSLFASLLLFCTGYLGHKTVSITLSLHRENYSSLLGRLLGHRFFLALPLGLLTLGTAVLIPSVVDYLATGKVEFRVYHWSRFFAMSTAYSAAFILTATRLLDITLDLLADRLEYLRANGAPGPLDVPGEP
jgi:glycosyltransferase involved in cell wall biosynthesis